MSSANQGEFLFEKKHWKILLNKLKPSTRLLVMKYIDFQESVIVVGEEGEGDINRTLTLDICVNDKGRMNLTQKDANKLSGSISQCLIDTLLELEALPRDAKLNGKYLYKEPVAKEESSSQADDGFVYFIRNKDLFKIGVTTNLKRRMDELKPSEILNSVRCTNYMAVEKDLHRFFKDSRIPQTEYFRLDKSQVKSVHRLMTKLAEF